MSDNLTLGDSSTTVLDGTSLDYAHFDVYSNQYCQYRLPCGLCEKLGYDCPRITHFIPTNKITCQN